MIDVLGAIARQATHTAAPRDTSVTMVAVLITPPDESLQAQVSLVGSEPITLPAVASTYTGVTTVHVLMDAETGRPRMVLGPAGTPEPETLPPPAVPPTPEAPRVQTVTGRVIVPSASGTWRTSRSGWDRWNLAGDVYQAGSASSGPLSGLAVYGNQITSLGASRITRGVLTLVSSGNAAGSSWTADVRPSAHASLPGSAPTYLATPPASVAVPGYRRDGAVVTVELTPAILENLRTGAAASLGLATLGDYGGTRGIRDSRAWTLALDYEVPA